MNDYELPIGDPYLPAQLRDNDIPCNRDTGSGWDSLTDEEQTDAVNSYVEDFADDIVQELLELPAIVNNEIRSKVGMKIVSAFLRRRDANL